MGRPKIVGEKKIVGSVSYSVEDKEFLDSKGLSLSKIVQDKLFELRSDAGQNPKNVEFNFDLEQVRVIFVKSERGVCQKESYFTAIQMFMEKWQDITKPEVMALVERPRYYKEKEEPKGEDEKDGEGKCL
jgi:hypothetical protein